MGGKLGPDDESDERAGRGAELHFERVCGLGGPRIARLEHVHAHVHERALLLVRRERDVAERVGEQQRRRQAHVQQRRLDLQIGRIEVLDALVVVVAVAVAVVCLIGALERAEQAEAKVQQLGVAYLLDLVEMQTARRRRRSVARVVRGQCLAESGVVGALGHVASLLEQLEEGDDELEVAQPLARVVVLDELVGCGGGGGHAHARQHVARGALELAEQRRCVRVAREELVPQSLLHLLDGRLSVAIRFR